MKLSNESKKPTKKQAFELVAVLKDGSRALTEVEKDSLVLYFAPLLPKKAATAFEWVAKACDERGVREALNYVYVVDGMAYGTNGHRLHRAAVDLPDGFYEPKTGSRVDSGSLRYPANISSLFNNNQEVLDRKAVSGFSVAADKLNGKAIKKLLAEPFDLNESYILAAVNHDKTRELAVVRDRCFGSSEFGEFVVMGIMH